MRILLGDIPEIQRDPLVRSLSEHHEVVLFQGDVRDRDTCLTQADCDIVIHGLPETDDSLLALDRASRGTWNLLTTTSASRYILLSSMRLFDAYGSGWQIDEGWSPRPTPAVGHLAPYLAEVAAREISRSRAIECIMVRLDDVVAADRFESEPIASTWLHLDDAVAAICGAVETEAQPSVGRWSALHVVRGGAGSRYPLGRLASEPFVFMPHQGIADSGETSVIEPNIPARPAPLREISRPAKIVIFGAGGPLGAITADLLKPGHELRVTDYRSLREIAALPPQSEGAPLPSPVESPHQERQVDVTDPDAVRVAVDGMDAIINCTVMRNSPVEAFRVNVLGAFNIMQAAVDAGIRRVVQTGPVLTLAPHPAGYTDDRDVQEDVPARPGDSLYFISKFLGQEVCRIFAEAYGIACPTLLFSGFVDPVVAARHAALRTWVAGSFTVSWLDSAKAMVAATRVQELPAPFVVFHILADAPHDRYRNDAAKQLLGWQPQDRLDHLWYRRP